MMEKCQGGSCVFLSNYNYCCCWLVPAGGGERERRGVYGRNKARTLSGPPAVRVLTAKKMRQCVSTQTQKKQNPARAAIIIRLSIKSDLDIRQPSSEIQHRVYAFFSSCSTAVEECCLRRQVQREGHQLLRRGASVFFSAAREQIQSRKHRSLLQIEQLRGWRRMQQLLRKTLDYP